MCPMSFQRYVASYEIYAYASYDQPSNGRN